MEKKINKALGIFSVMALTLGSQTAFAGMLDKDDFSPEQLASIKVSMPDAVKKAQASQSGTPIKVELEQEDKALVYEIEFLSKDKEKKVKVDAVTGEVTTESKK